MWHTGHAYVTILCEVMWISKKKLDRTWTEVLSVFQLMTSIIFDTV
jgi:hypothetical protein